MIMRILSIILIVLCLGYIIRADETKKERAAVRARLAKAKTMQEALIILKASGKQGRLSLISPEQLKKEEQQIHAKAQQMTRNAHSMTEPRNGGCEPRVVCEEVPVDRSQSELIVSYPQCVEVHRCGGCCQEPQFPCLPVRQVPVTFSPLLLISLDDTDRYEVNRPLTLMNHTQCECKCSKTEDQCQREGKILDANLCQCVQPRCVPECPISSTCSMVPGMTIPRCTCRRRLQGQTGNYCPISNQRPNVMCTRCETIIG